MVAHSNVGLREQLKLPLHHLVQTVDLGIVVELYFLLYLLPFFLVDHAFEKVINGENFLAFLWLFRRSPRSSLGKNEVQVASELVFFVGLLTLSQNGISYLAYLGQLGNPIQAFQTFTLQVLS